MVVAEKTRSDSNVIGADGKWEKFASKALVHVDSIPLMFYRQRESVPWSPAIVSQFRLLSKVRHLKPDVINIHWTNQGFLSVEALRLLNSALVWTIHDMWPFTGGCHYAGGCERYLQRCGKCPQLGSRTERDLSRLNWVRKSRVYASLKPIILSPSRWLADLAKKSALLGKFRVETIPNGLDLEIFRRTPKKLARKLLLLPQNSKLILFGATGGGENKRKGFNFLVEAANRIPPEIDGQNTSLLLFGGGAENDLPNVQLPCISVGRLNDDISLALLYSAADVFVAPSLEDNLPTTIMESLACGTPVVAFRVGGIPEMIDHKSNGYLAGVGDSADLARGIIWTLKNADRWKKLCIAARVKAEKEFDIEKISRQYLALYQSAMNVE